jgi:hypothetical protein
VKDILFAPANSETTHNLNFTLIRVSEVKTKTTKKNDLLKVGDVQAIKNIP